LHEATRNARQGRRCQDRRITFENNLKAAKTVGLWGSLIKRWAVRARPATACEMAAKFALSTWLLVCAAASSTPFASPSSFQFTPRPASQPRLVLVGGCTGTGKSTFGMEIALKQGILKCVSTDTVREVTRAFDHVTPALHRSSYSGEMDALVGWKEASAVLDKGITALVDDAIKRGVSLVLEGVHIVPSNGLLDKWRESGGIALGCLLIVPDPDAHRCLIYNRGEVTGKGEVKKMVAFERIRTIQDEMIRLAREHDWVIVEQKLEPDPIDVVTALLRS
jgi:2-phosphoglycerate kinase